jgi:hypothetical protein
MGRDPAVDPQVESSVRASTMSRMESKAWFLFII